jgi:hypothetical protein
MMIAAWFYLYYLFALILFAYLGWVVIGLIVSQHHQNPPSRARLSDNNAWEGGSKQQVTWRFTGAVPRVHIMLQSAFTLIPFTWIIEYDIKNHGSHVVTVPTGLVPGKYYLKIISMSDDRVSATSPTFTIDKMATPPEINDVAIPRCLVAVGRLQA